MFKLNPKLINDLIIITKSKPIPFGIICIRQNFNEIEQKELINISLNIQNNNYGRKFFKIFSFGSLYQ
jgi:hypothetical protein